MEEKKLTHKMTCHKCGEQIEFNQDDVLNEMDWSEATDVRVVSLRCPYCWERNIISETGMDGKKKTHIKVETI